MSPEQIEMAQALVAAPWWEWRSGMQHFTRTAARDGERSVFIECVLPDLGDHATIGILIGLLGESLRGIHQRTEPSGWSVVYSENGDGRPSTTGWRNSLGEAIAMALLKGRA